jgi:hypothetical protein
LGDLGGKILTYTQMLKIIDEVMIGEKRTVFGKEADEFREDFKKDVEFAKENGDIIEIPFEFPDPPDRKRITKTKV